MATLDDVPATKLNQRKQLSKTWRTDLGFYIPYQNLP